MSYNELRVATTFTFTKDSHHDERVPCSVKRGVRVGSNSTRQRLVFQGLGHASQAILLSPVVFPTHEISDREFSYITDLIRWWIARDFVCLCKYEASFVVLLSAWQNKQFFFDSSTFTLWIQVSVLCIDKTHKYVRYLYLLRNVW